MGSGYEARRGVADASGDVSRANPAPSINPWLALSPGYLYTLSSISINQSNFIYVTRNILAQPYFGL